MANIRYIAVGAGVLGAGYFALSRMEDFKTPGIKNIESRWSSGGGSDSYTSASATKRGDPNSVEPVQQSTHGGVATKEFQDSYANQRPKPGAIEAKWNKTHYGAEGGK